MRSEQDNTDGNTQPQVLGQEKRPKTRRRGTVFTCRHGCGMTYNRAEDPLRKNRDKFDYHERQGCSLIVRSVCPLECRLNSFLMTFSGRKALSNHRKSKVHLARTLELGVSAEEVLQMPPKSVLDYPHEVFEDRKTKVAEMARNSRRSSRLATVTFTRAKEKERQARELQQRKLVRENKQKKRRRKREMKTQLEGCVDMAIDVMEESFSADNHFCPMASSDGSLTPPEVSMMENPMLLELDPIFGFELGMPLYDTSVVGLSFPSLAPLESFSPCGYRPH